MMMVTLTTTSCTGRRCQRR
ncbi:hypothetical protein E2C01_073815 [Portunus trituberculatus]|uniref:Uncharacterized protein n=1 Tax=Portunus trituberculatus TaxID=210409 RepID=A0A5B7ICN7_PORTR|nr:hypothetical protein [Portunus trituberculatus]